MPFLRKIVISLLFLICSFQAMAQSNLRNLPDVELKTLAGENVKSTSLINSEGLTIINFWATWCKPCVLELNSIAEVLADWKKEINLRFLAVSIDDSRNTSKVGPLVNGKSWPFEIFLDPNSEFKRALNVNNIPHTFLLNSKGEILWQHNSYSPGDEDELFEVIRKFDTKP